MSAEIVAKMVQLLQQDRFSYPEPSLMPGENRDNAINTLFDIAQVAIGISKVSEIIDASAMVPEVFAYVDELRKQQHTNGPVTVSNASVLHEFTLAPPWESAVVGYSGSNNEGDTHGLIVMYHTADATRVNQGWESDGDEVEWDRVKWVVMAIMFPYTPEAGLHGPSAIWRVAVYEDGDGAYVWTKNTVEGTLFVFDLMVLFNTLNICNAMNVYLDVPERQRAVRRRIERTGVRVTEIHVRPRKGYKPGAKGVALQPGVPLTSVRGHFNHYGPKYGRGLLFGRIEGKFWIPQHVRGTEECGTIEHSYTVESV